MKKQSQKAVWRILGKETRAYNHFEGVDFLRGRADPDGNLSDAHRILPSLNEILLWHHGRLVFLAALLDDDWYVLQAVEHQHRRHAVAVLFEDYFDHLLVWHAFDADELQKNANQSSEPLLSQLKLFHKKSHYVLFGEFEHGRMLRVVPERIRGRLLNVAAGLTCEQVDAHRVLLLGVVKQRPERRRCVRLKTQGGLVDATILARVLAYLDDKLAKTKQKNK